MENASFTIYNASAGSGKTYTLAKEYIKILLKSPANDAYKNILAITFTNKAVEEMKSRILFYLLQFASEQTNEKALPLLQDISNEIKLSIATVKEKSKLIIKSIIHNYASFNISTIDKFTLKVIKSFAHELNIPLDFDVSLETSDMLQEAVDLVVSKAGTDEKLTKLLLDFSRNKTEDDKSWDITFDLLKISELIAKESSKKEILNFENKTIEDFVEQKKIIGQEIKKLKEQVASISSECLQILENNGVDSKSFSRASFPKHLETLLNGTFDFKKKYDFVEEVEVNKTAKDKDVIESILPQIIGKLKIAYELYGTIFLYEDFNKNLYPLSLLNDINKEFKKIQEEQNLLSIAEFNQLINNEIENQPAPFIYEKIGDRFRHFFIDEFQDTSELQWKNFFPLLDNALSSEENNTKGTLMLVGDPKQSIYRWRGGKPELFIDLSKNKNPFSNPEKEVTKLDTNYRSFSEIIEFNNSFFRFLASKLNKEDYVDLYQNNSFQKSNNKKGGYVEIKFIDTKQELIEEETEDEPNLYLIETLKTINQVVANGFQWSDIVVLTRTQMQGVQIANFLTENNIEILSSETLLIQNATEVKLIIDVFKYLVNQKDVEAKFKIYYFAFNSLNKELYKFHNQINIILNNDTILFEKELEKLDIKFSFEECKNKSMYEIAERIVSAFIKEKANNSYVQFFLDLILEKQVKNQMSIDEFLEYWNNSGFKKSIPSPEGKNAVKIMTIHKSKGLEFPVVIYPFANDNYSKNKSEPLWIPSSTDSNINFDKLLIGNNKSIINYSENISNIYHEKEQERILDQINVLYVVLTRAVEQLYVISEMKINKNGNLPNMLSSYFIEYLQLNKNFSLENSTYFFGSPIRISANETHQVLPNSISVVKKRMNPNSIKIADREALMWGTLQQAAIEFGNIIHKIMSFITSEEDIDLALKKSLEFGLINISQIPQIKEIIIQIINHNDLNKFYKKTNKVFNERAILGFQNKNLVPDRIVLTGINEILLLDYKTGIFLEKHKKQLLEYESILIEMGFVVKEKVLVYLEENLKIIHL